MKGDNLTYTGVGPDVPLTEDLPILPYGNFTIERFSEADPYTQHFRLIDADSDAVYVLHRSRWSGFYCEMLCDHVWEQPILGREGYSTESQLVWDDGGGICLMTFVPDNWSTAVGIAESLQFN